MLTTLSMIILIISFTMFLSTNPLSMGIIILMLALMTTMLFSMTMSSWLSFLIFLIYISGMLVLFSYFVAMSPNTPMSSLTINIIMFLSPLLIISIMMLTPTKTPTLLQPEIFITHLYTNHSAIITIILASILLLAMVIVVKMISMKSGPLRPFINFLPSNTMCMSISTR